MPFAAMDGTRDCHRNYITYVQSQIMTNELIYEDVMEQTQAVVPKRVWKANTIIYIAMDKLKIYCFAKNTVQYRNDRKEY